MINHVRTLLLNQPGNSGVGYNAPGEEFVDPLYVPRQLPGFLSTALSQLFGTKPDRLYLNYRLWQVMALLHTSELEQHVLDFDPRVTYWPVVDADFFDKVFGHTVEQYAGPGTKTYITGEHVADEGAGLTTQQWQLEVQNSNILEIKRLSPPVSTDLVPYAVIDGLTEPISLPGTGLAIRFHAAPVGTAWIVTSRARPVLDGATLIGNMTASLGEGNVNRVFNLGSTVDRIDEPFVTYRNLFKTNDLFPYKHGAVLIGAAHYIDTLPQVLS